MKCAIPVSVGILVGRPTPNRLPKPFSNSRISPHLSPTSSPHLHHPPSSSSNPCVDLLGFPRVYLGSFGHPLPLKFQFSMCTPPLAEIRDRFVSDGSFLLPRIKSVSEGGNESACCGPPSDVISGMFLSRVSSVHPGHRSISGHALWKRPSLTPSLLLEACQI